MKLSAPKRKAVLGPVLTFAFKLCQRRSAPFGIAATHNCLMIPFQNISKEQSTDVGEFFPFIRYNVSYWKDIARLEYFCELRINR